MPENNIPDLIQIIRDNPGGTVWLDNDSWRFYAKESRINPHLPQADEHDAWGEADQESRFLITSQDRFMLDGVLVEHPEAYGGDILKALASIVGITIKND